MRSTVAGEAPSTADAVAPAQQAEAIALHRYRNGLVSYLDVIYAKTALQAKPGQHAPRKPAVLPKGGRDNPRTQRTNHLLVTPTRVMNVVDVTKFRIDADNNTTALGVSQQIEESRGETETFGNLQELTALAEKWSAARLVEIWSGLPDAQPVQRFTNRQVATNRIWKAL